jgi:hypothetical protein
MLKKLRSVDRRACRILHIHERLQCICTRIAVAWLPVCQDSKATGSAQTYAVVLRHQHHAATLRWHQLRLLLEYSESLLAHVGGCLRKAINIFYISFTKLDGVGRI